MNEVAWTYLHTPFDEHMHSFFSSIYLEMELLDGNLGIRLTFEDIIRPFSNVVELI